MYDQFNRKINYLRISVTDRCNLRCVYCMPAEGIEMSSHDEILSFDEIVDVTKAAVSLGIDKVRITGGEPLVRKGIVELVKMIAGIEGINDLGLTTNGAMLDRFARPMADAGLNRVNISLDTLDAEKYWEVTRIGNIEEVFRGIRAAQNAGLEPVKMNCVVKNSADESDAQTVKKFAEENNFQIRFIPEMNLETGSFGKVIGGEGGNCKLCNRLRLTATGKIKPCLFSDIEFDVRKLGPTAAINLALGNKPPSGTVNLVNQFHNIGG